jgi:TPR repeat protein
MMDQGMVEEAAFALGQTYYFGNPMTGVQPDYQRAREYFEIAADR